MEVTIGHGIRIYNQTLFVDILIYTLGQTEDPNPLANFPDNTSGQDIAYTFILETWIDSSLIVNSGGLQCPDLNVNIIIHPRPTIDIFTMPVCEGDISTLELIFNLDQLLN